MVRKLMKWAAVATACLWTVVPGRAGEPLRPQTFDAGFRTVTLTNPDYFMSAPLLRLGTSDRLLLSFDEIADDNRYLRARLVHCNADWTPSTLLDSEYVPTFNEEEITDYAFSDNAFVHYVNYQLELPSERLAPTVSGNYLVQVYDEADPETVLLQKRFMVSDETATLKGSMTHRTMRGANNGWQQVEAEAHFPDRSVMNPYTDLQLVVQQNGDSGSARTLRTPLRATGSSAVYEMQDALVFPAGNEYRRFETVTVSQPGMHVDSLRYIGSNYHAFLTPDQPRGGAYCYDRTQHGRYLVREWNSSDSSVGADYVTVHFQLDGLPEATEVYLDGDFTDGLSLDQRRMLPGDRRGSKVLEMPLKQGSYNYRYLVKGPDGRLRGIDGDFSETDNEYLLLLYYRPPGARTDRLIGSLLLQ